MALLRLIAAFALIGCAQAGADPAAARSGIAVPAGWRALPELAGAIGDAARSAGTSLDGTAAWGEPAMGCYAAWLALSGGSTGARELADQILAGLATEHVVAADVVKPAADTGVLSLGFERPPYRGRLRAQLDRGKISALACFANRREPGACDAVCNALLGALQ
jgi:hypothetical protein